jgi:hypothetical protein
MTKCSWHRCVSMCSASLSASASASQSLFLCLPVSVSVSVFISVSVSVSVCWAGALKIEYLDRMRLKRWRLIGFLWFRYVHLCMCAWGHTKLILALMYRLDMQRSWFHLYGSKVLSTFQPHTHIHAHARIWRHIPRKPHTHTHTHTRYACWMCVFVYVLAGSRIDVCVCVCGVWYASEFSGSRSDRWLKCRPRRSI